MRVVIRSVNYLKHYKNTLLSQSKNHVIKTFNQKSQYYSLFQ